MVRFSFPAWNTQNAGIMPGMRAPGGGHDLEQPDRVQESCSCRSARVRSKLPISRAPCTVTQTDNKLNPAKTTTNTTFHKAIQKAIIAFLSAAGGGTRDSKPAVCLGHHAVDSVRRGLSGNSSEPATIAIRASKTEAIPTRATVSSSSIFSERPRRSTMSTR